MMLIKFSNINDEEENIIDQYNNRIYFNENTKCDCSIGRSLITCLCELII